MLAYWSRFSKYFLSCLTLSRAVPFVPLLHLMHTLCWHRVPSLLRRYYFKHPSAYKNFTFLCNVNVIFPFCLILLPFLEYSRHSKVLTNPAFLLVHPWLSKYLVFFYAFGGYLSMVTYFLKQSSFNPISLHFLLFSLVVQPCFITPHSSRSVSGLIDFPLV